MNLASRAAICSSQACSALRQILDVSHGMWPPRWICLEPHGIDVIEDRTHNQNHPNTAKINSSGHLHIKWSFCSCLFSSHLPRKSRAVPVFNLVRWKMNVFSLECDNINRLLKIYGSLYKEKRYAGCSGKETISSIRKKINKLQTTIPLCHKSLIPQLFKCLPWIYL